MKEASEIVYLIDDDARVREAISELLATLKIECVTFGSAEEYLGFKRSDACACLILDLNLPNKSGLDLQQELRDGLNPPIIFISGYGDVPSTVRAMKRGAIEFLTKPLDRDRLLLAIRMAFAKDLEQRKKTGEVLDLQRRFALLTPREQEVLPLIAGGMLNKQAAAVLGITEVTLQVHRGQIMRKMKAQSFADLVRMAERLDIPARDTTL